jgi:hypothetical protein
MGSMLRTGHVQRYLQFLDRSILLGPLSVSQILVDREMADIAVQRAERSGMKNSLENHLGSALLS